MDAPAPVTQVTKKPAESEAHCFLCGTALRRDYGEPIEGGEGVVLCRACGAIYRYPALCC